MTESASLMMVTFLAMSSLALLVFMLVGGRRNRLDERLQDLNGEGEGAATPDTMADFARATLPKMGAVMLPKSTEERTKLQTRLIHAGLYGRQAAHVFLGVK